MPHNIECPEKALASAILYRAIDDWKKCLSIDSELITNIKEKKSNGIELTKKEEKLLIIVDMREEILTFWGSKEFYLYCNLALLDGDVFLEKLKGLEAKWALDREET